MIPKPGKKEGRPLGVGAPREKIVQKGIQIILETIYEPRFLDCSHGFRPNRSTHSALKLLHLKTNHHKWVIQGDITQCFPSLPHSVIMDLIRKDIACDRTLELIKKALTVGYVNSKSGQILKSNVGTPQGSVLSPLLANLVLHELDVYIQERIIPEFHRGRKRRTNPAYNALVNTRYGKKKGVTPEQKKAALKEMLTLPRADTKDPNYRRSMFVRYADDFVFLFDGPRSEAITIKAMIKDFLSQLGLDLNDEKTIISHISEGFHFLGAHIQGIKHTGYMVRN